MSVSTRLSSAQQAENTRVKLAMLEEQYDAAQKRTMKSDELKQLTLYSLRDMINQLKEELILYECDVKSGRIPPISRAS